MTRTQRNQRGKPSSGGKTTSNTQQRQSNVSHTLSKVLRHQAENERIPITKEGWVKLSDLLAWRGLSDPAKFNPPVTVGEIMEVVKEDGIHGKGRFGLKLGKNLSLNEPQQDIPGTDTPAIDELLTEVQHAYIKADEDSYGTTTVTDTKSMEASQEGQHSSKNTPETLAVIAHQAENPNISPSSYFIRATQGHSIKAIESEGLLTPITLENPSSIPEIVVHGTFYGAWDSILSTGGLKPMSRNMVHFASGPALSEVLPTTDIGEAIANQPAQTTTSLTNKKQVDDMLSQNKVISGMRWDAQILIYIDLKRLLEDVRDKGWEMKWWRSDNGVILSEGVIMPPDNSGNDINSHAATKISQLDTSTDEPGEQEDTMTKARDGADKEADKFVKLQHRTKAKAQKKPVRSTAKVEKLVPLAYFDAVVEIKAGVGLLWRAGEGIIREVPEHLRVKGVPRGKGPRAGDSGPRNQNKPRVQVERDGDLCAQIDTESG